MLATRRLPQLCPSRIRPFTAYRGLTMATKPTILRYQHDAKTLVLKSTIQSILPITDLSEDDRFLFKTAKPDTDSILITAETVFHPQGGGQPTDEGTMSSSDTQFKVKNVRLSTDGTGRVMHCGEYTSGSPFTSGQEVELSVDAEKRLLYSRLHTAGHVLGVAVRHLLEKEVEGFDELKANHFPDSASCEFQGLIDGKHKAAIQAKVDEYVAKAAPVEVEFWSEEDFKANAMVAMMPDKSFLPPGETKFRVVRLKGLETYPCGGTHVDSTDLCGQTTVKKVSRNKGTSRVSYTVVA